MLKNKTTYQQKDDAWIERKRTRDRETSGVGTAILKVETKDAQV